MEHEYFEGFPRDSNSRRDLGGRRIPVMNSSPANIPEEAESLVFPHEEPVNHPSPRGQAPRPRGGNVVVSYEERYERVLDVSLWNCIISTVMLRFLLHISS